MRVAAVAWQQSILSGIKSQSEFRVKVEQYLNTALINQTDLIVFPGFSGCYYQQLKYDCDRVSDLKNKAGTDYYLKEMKKLSQKYKMLICPGSLWEEEGKDIYHTSYLLQDGEILIKQRQIYLADWERELDLSRGKKVRLAEFNGWKIGLVLATDLFYPQVSRELALKGADLIISPVGFTGPDSKAFQISGAWREVQQNLFFAVESAFNGDLADLSFHSESWIHAPLEMTEKDDGFLARNRGGKEIIYARLNNKQREKAKDRFDVLKQLNPELYYKMKMLQKGEY